ncbi:MAG: sulfotransferase domain-containing protein [Spirochaetota bacterium]|nr:sulfotransferase domain-containing protein [Spirochaetota bacterium]
MIIISAGMQKSGSGYYFNLVNDLLVALKKQDVREIKKNYQLESVLNHYNCNILPTKENMERLIPPHKDGNYFVVKTHSGLNEEIKNFSLEKICKCLYIFRDPRDVILSAMDHANRSAEEKQFQDFKTFEDGLKSIKSLLENWEKWYLFSDRLMVKYEDLLDDPIKEIKRLSEYLSLDVSGIDLDNLVKKYSTKDLKEKKLGFTGLKPLSHEGQMNEIQEDEKTVRSLHFNKGETRRYETELSQEEKDRFNELYGDFLEKMGYD